MTHVRSVSTRVADSVKAMLADCTLFVYGLLTLVIILNAESKMLPQSGFERRQCFLKFASLCLTSAQHCHVVAERIFVLSFPCHCKSSIGCLGGVRSLRLPHCYGVKFFSLHETPNGLVPQAVACRACSQAARLVLWI